MVPKARLKQTIMENVAPRSSLSTLSCRSWAVADATTGALVDSCNLEEEVLIASVTKVMTALVVLKAIEYSGAGGLDEILECSASAASVVGTSAKLRAGDRLTVRDLLHGMLLPSGNDAATLLAEHFGALEFCASVIGEPMRAGESSSGYDRFVQAMNAFGSGTLGMTRTVFRNPHGLTTPAPLATTSCASDVVRMCVAAWTFPTLREIVGARRYVASCERVADSGPARSVVSLRFVNTNALLGASADDRISWTCDGLKTGWTRRAGGCLTTHVTCAGGQELIVVTLGSRNKMRRFVDNKAVLQHGYAQRQR